MAYFCPITWTFSCVLVTDRMQIFNRQMFGALPVCWTNYLTSLIGSLFTESATNNWRLHICWPYALMKSGTNIESSQIKIVFRNQTHYSLLFINRLSRLFVWRFGFRNIKLCVWSFVLYIKMIAFASLPLSLGYLILESRGIQSLSQ